MSPGGSGKSGTVNPTKQLLLLRHAKSSWDDPSVADIDRPLAPRGRRAAARIGRELAARGWLPEMALVSPAVRTRESWQLLVTASRPMPAPTIQDDLYEASAEQLLAQVRQAPETVRTLLLLGHNPGLQDFALRLANETSSDVALRRLREKLPTAGLARFEFPGRWAELTFGGARLSLCLRPKDLD